MCSSGTDALRQMKPNAKLIGWVSCSAITHTAEGSFRNTYKQLRTIAVQGTNPQAAGGDFLAGSPSSSVCHQEVPCHRS